MVRNHSRRVKTSLFHELIRGIEIIRALPLPVVPVGRHGRTGTATVPITIGTNGLTTIQKQNRIVCLVVVWNQLKINSKIQPYCCSNL